MSVSSYLWREILILENSLFFKKFCVIQMCFIKWE